MAMSEEARRAKNREKQRRYRERQAEARAAAKSVTGNGGDGDVPTVVRDAVEAALGSAKWLTESDAGSIAQARALAARIDRLEHADETTKVLSAHRALSQVLNDLGATASRRLQYELRSLRLHGGKLENTDDGDLGATAEASGNVSEFRRPKGRRAR